MGAGSSVPSLKKAMHDPEAARKIFDDMDANHDTELTVVELYDATRRYGEQISAEWTLDLIKATVERFDANGDGKINLEEFQTALDNLVAVKAPKGGGKRKSLKGSTGNLKATLKRAWTFKKLPTNMQDLISDAVEADAHDKEDEAEQAQADAMAMAMAPAMTIEEKEAKFWEVQEAQACWKVPFGLNRDRMPWAKDGETGLSLAIARARLQGKTPLLVDPSFDMICDRHYTAEEHGHKVLKARAMFEDEAQKKRTHGEVMNESRKLIVEAMREGKTFYIQLEKKVTDFAGGNYSGKDTLPMQIFDQRVVAELAAYYTTSERVERSDDTGWKGLWESEHPFAKILRDGDTDTKGRFLVDPAFNVVVCTQKKIEEYNLDLRNSMPMGRLQAIFPMPGPI